MKKKILLHGLLIVIIGYKSEAQHIKSKLNFPAGVVLHAPGAAPFKEAVWIGPEWKWNGGNYLHVPGYWAKPIRRKHWVPGHWKYARRGYSWVPGHWK